MSYLIRVKPRLTMGKYNRIMEFTNFGNNEKRFNSKCVVYIIDSCRKKENNISLSAIEMSQLITDQYINLWNVMKRGDFIEDISVREKHNDNDDVLHGIYIVDEESNQPLNINIIKNGLIIKNIANADNYNLILENMYTIIDFPIGYFDDLTYVNCTSRFYITTEDCKLSKYSILIILDNNKLHLNKLEHHDVLHEQSTIKNEVSLTINYVHYLYVIVKYKKIPYLIITERSYEDDEYNLNDNVDKFISLFKNKTIYLKHFSFLDNTVVKRIAKSNNVTDNHILLI
jgi:hypothetical protein